MKNQQGFAQMLLIVTLPILIGAFVLIYSLAGLTQLNAQVNGDCRRLQVRTQAEIRVHILKLFAKNPQAINLRQQLTIAEAKLLAATLSQNYALATKMTMKIQNLNLKRSALRIYQNALIAQANILANAGSAKVYVQTLKHIADSKGLNPLLKINMLVNLPSFYRLPVVPIYPDAAPPYKPDADFSKRQALVQKWQYQITIQPWLQRFVTGKSKFEKICSTTIEGEGREWLITTKEDRS